MKVFVSEIDIITTLFTRELIRHNKVQLRFIDKSVLKLNVDKYL